MYATPQNIIDEFKGMSFTGANGVTESNIFTWITQESNYIDGRISTRYIAPVDSTDYPEAFSILERICTFRVCERVKNKLEIKSNVTQLDNEQKYSNNYVRTPNHDLDSIAKGDIILKGVPLVNSGGGVSSSSIECDVSSCHTFDVDKQQW